jgi:hypothetical protein
MDLFFTNTLLKLLFGRIPSAKKIAEGSGLVPKDEIAAFFEEKSKKSFHFNPFRNLLKD